MGPGGMHSFGHAAYFGLGAYGAALLLKWLAASRSALALIAAPMLALARRLAVRLVRGAAVRRLSRNADAWPSRRSSGPRCSSGSASPAAPTASSASGRKPPFDKTLGVYFLLAVALAASGRAAAAPLPVRAVRLRDARRARLAACAPKPSAST